MGLLYLLNAVLGLQHLPPFAFEIIVVAICIILLACPVPLAEDYTFTNEDEYPICQTLILTEDEDDDEEPTVVTKITSKPSNHDNTPECDVPKVLEHTASLIKSIEFTLKNIDKTNNDIIVNNINICTKDSDTTFARAFRLDGVEEYHRHHDRRNIKTGAVDLGEIKKDSRPDVDAGVHPYYPDRFDVASEDSYVSDGSVISSVTDEHGSLVSDSDEEHGGITGGVFCPISRRTRQLIELRRTDETTHLSGILVASLNESNDHLTAPLFSEDNRANDTSLTHLILDAKLDLNMLRDGFQLPLTDSENVSSESSFTSSEYLFPERLSTWDEDSGSELGLLDNVMNSRPWNTERPLRSLDTLQDGVDYQDLENISEEDLKTNKQFFIDKFINDEEIKNHARFTRSKREILIEEIPIDKNHDATESLAYVNTLIETDLEAENKYINPTFTMNNFSSDSDFQLGGTGFPVIEERDITVPAYFVRTLRQGVSECDALSKISEENLETKETTRYKSFSTFSDFKTKNTVLSETINANSDGIICDDTVMKRYETIQDYTISAHDRPCESNPFLDVLSGSMQDLYSNKGLDILESKTNDLKKLNGTFKESSGFSVAAKTVSLPVSNTSLNSHHAGTYISPAKDVLDDLEWDANSATQNKDNDLSDMSSRCRLIFGARPLPSSPLPSKEDILAMTGSQDTSTEHSTGLSAGNSCWQFRENVKAKKIVFDKDTFLRRKQESFHFNTNNSGSMSNLFDDSDNMDDVSDQESSGNDVASGHNSSYYVEKCKEEESDIEKDPAMNGAEEATKLRTSRPSLQKLKLHLFKTKSREKSNSDSSAKLSGDDLTESLTAMAATTSKSKSKTYSKRSRVFDSKKENGVKDEGQSCSKTKRNEDSRAGPSERPEEEDNDDDLLESNTFTKLFHKIARKLKGNSSTKATTTPSRQQRPQHDNKNISVQNKLYVFKGNQGVAAFPTEDPFVVDRNSRSLDFFYSELQSDHHTLKVTTKKVDIPASGSSTDANTDLHLAALMEDLDE